SAGPRRDPGGGGGAGAGGAGGRGGTAGTRRMATAQRTVRACRAGGVRWAAAVRWTATRRPERTGPPREPARRPVTVPRQATGRPKTRRLPTTTRGLRPANGDHAYDRLSGTGARGSRENPAGPRHVLRRHSRIPGRERPAPGRPGDGPVGRRRGLVAGDPRRRLLPGRSRAGSPSPLSGRGHPVAPHPGRRGERRGYAPRPLAHASRLTGKAAWAGALAPTCSPAPSPAPSPGCCPPCARPAAPVTRGIRAGSALTPALVDSRAPGDPQ